ncbi:MAG: M36 family metallopeptidase, partial [Planctomycetota bacterium]
MGGRKPNSKYDYSRLEARQMLSANLPDTDAQVELAKQYLASQPETAYLLEGQSDVQLVQLKHGLASTTTRFQQTIDGLPVHNGLITINQGPDGQFQRVHHELAFTPQEANFPQRQDDQVEVTFGQAEIAAMDFAGIDKIDLESRGELSWFVQQDGDAVLAWDIAVFNLTDSVGDYYTVVDAASGNVLFQENRAKFYTTGSGFSYEPNPYQTAGNGAGLVDNNDATSPELDAQRINVILEGLNEDTGLLIGEFVDLATLNSPTIEDNDADEPSRIYEYDRDDPRFEQVVVYSSVDQINRYFHSLGFDDDSGTPNGIRDFPTLANAHWFEADNSFYSTGNDAIHFGDGGVDDAEDADIVAHEYGHAVQLNQNTFYFGGDTGAMGEGFSDYLGAIFYRDAGDTQFLSEHAAAVGEWDATSYSSDNPPNLRRVDGNKMYPRDLVGQVHADGEIWSRALWDLAKHVGADYANQIILEHHFTLEAAATMPTAANAIIAAN